MFSGSSGTIPATPHQHWWTPSSLPLMRESRTPFHNLTIRLISLSRANASFSIFTGDVPSDQVWTSSVAQATSDLAVFYQAYPGAVYATGGNHDTSPVRSGGPPSVETIFDVPLYLPGERICAGLNDDELESMGLRSLCEELGPARSFEALRFLLRISPRHEPAHYFHQHAIILPVSFFPADRNWTFPQG